ncbi:farnesol dehydrogenase-like isoform X2 [Planococcus citri]|uniref:farnesol dehydrogenase-like isoform X2 n=1 Tax=Planococcus citri TaxID=170843 RepID=UPI0031F8F53A
MERFSGTVAVVTGSSAGIGVAISKELLKRGLIVAGLARREDKLKLLKEELDKSGYKGKFHPIQCDITNEQDIISAFEKIKTIGKLSILVNNAGVLQVERVHEISSSAFDSVFDTNVKGLVFCAQQAIKIMKENSIRGHIVNVCSIAGTPSWVPKLQLGIYSASKHAVKVISDALRREMILEKTKIKVTNLSPGLVETDMTEKYLPDDPDEYISAQDIANACIAVLDTPPSVVFTFEKCKNL